MNKIKFGLPKNRKNLFWGSLIGFLTIILICFSFIYMHNISPKISIIIPIYNCEDYLEETLNSVVNQSTKNIEIICVNDGTPDNSMEILQKFQKNDKRIKILEQPNSGVSAARNNGLRHAKGEYILFLDSDDIVSKDVCKIAYANAKKYFADVSYFKSTDFNDGEEIPWQEYNPDPKLVSFYTRNPKKEPFKNLSFGEWAIWNKIWKRKFLLENNLFFCEDIRQAEDTLFNIFAVQKVKTHVKDKNILHYYRVRQASLSSAYEGQTSKSKETQLKNLMKCVKEIIKNLEIFEFENKNSWILDEIFSFVNTKRIIDKIDDVSKRATYAKEFFDITGDFIQNNKNKFNEDQINEIESMKKLLTF